MRKNIINWWRNQSHTRQDRIVMLGPLAAVVLFAVLMTLVMLYLKTEEISREHDTLTRDAEYAQQSMRLRLIEGQEQISHLTHQISQWDMSPEAFTVQSNAILKVYPEMAQIQWIDAHRKMLASTATPPNGSIQSQLLDGHQGKTERNKSYEMAKKTKQTVFSTIKDPDSASTKLLVQVPILNSAQVLGAVMVDISMDNLIKLSIPNDIAKRYAIAILNPEQQILAGSVHRFEHPLLHWLPWGKPAPSYSEPILPLGAGFVIHIQSYRTSQDMVGSGVAWLISGLSFFTLWMLIITWRHMHRRIEAQQALIAETNFRRAMENSMPIGMRASDMTGKITYVNPAFCRLTGWTESEILDQLLPFPLAIDSQPLPKEPQNLMPMSSSSAEIRIKRRSGSFFHARMDTSPLINSQKVQTGWMTSITDISEPKRIREELSHSYQRFTTVLESLDSAISVAPLGSTELLFGNKLYKLWFGLDGQGHRRIIDMAGAPPTNSEDQGDQVDVFAGIPTNSLTGASMDSVELYMEDLHKWLEVRSRYITWIDGRLTQMIICTDITVKHLAHEKEAEQADRAQKASRLVTMGEMASSVAHELNQPLTAINNYCSGMISRIERQQMSNTELIEILEKTGKQARRAGQVIQRIKSFVKKSEPNPCFSSVADMVINAIELVDIELRRHQVRLVHCVADGLPPLFVDPILVEQVLINLIKNGAESIVHANRVLSDRVIHVNVDAVNHQQVIEFQVRDTGTGVPVESPDRIYDAFYSTKKEGMGIGLKLCRSIIESHQGRIQAENIYNDNVIIGCTFSFSIPIETPAPPAPDKRGNFIHSND